MGGKLKERVTPEPEEEPARRRDGRQESGGNSRCKGPEIGTT